MSRREENNTLVQMGRFICARAHCYKPHWKPQLLSATFKLSHRPIWGVGYWSSIYLEKTKNVQIHIETVFILSIFGKSHPSVCNMWLGGKKQCFWKSTPYSIPVHRQPLFQRAQTRQPFCRSPFWDNTLLCFYTVLRFKLQLKPSAMCIV